jgi:hypothetical protein
VEFSVAVSRIFQAEFAFGVDIINLNYVAIPITKHRLTSDATRASSLVLPENRSGECWAVGCCYLCGDFAALDGEKRSLAW